MKWTSRWVFKGLQEGAVLKKRKYFLHTGGDAMPGSWHRIEARH